MGDYAKTVEKCEVNTFESCRQGNGTEGGKHDSKICKSGNTGNGGYILF